MSSSDFPIVGVGASAGAVEALEGFFRGMPDSPGLAFVVVTHLSPGRDSMLPEIVARFTSLPVHSITDGMRVEMNSVYLLPHDAVLGIRDRTLQVCAQVAATRERRPIDVFFGALAEDIGELAVGVVLSGADSDGTLGVKAIKEGGGLTLAQSSDGFGPHHPDMPDSAISTGLVDFAVPVEQMGARLAEFARGAYEFDGIAASEHGKFSQARVDEAHDAICTLLRNQVGHDFSGYKTKTFLRRVQRRMQVLQIETPEAYVARLAAAPREATALFRDLLINVTSFFRDPEAFDSLSENVLARLFERRGADNPVRVWVPGCATGEEVYSIAMLLRERMAGLDDAPRVQVFATRAEGAIKSM